MFAIRAEELAEIEAGSDRMAAVLGCAYVEGALRDILIGLAVRDREATDSFFGPTGPVGNFAVQARYAHITGFIHKDLRDDLLLIARVRNKFAHDIAVNSFDHPDVQKAWMGGFKMATVGIRMKGRVPNSVANRTDFISAIGEIGGIFIRIRRGARPPADVPVGWHAIAERPQQ